MARKRMPKLKKRTKIIYGIVLIFVVVMGVACYRLHQQSVELKKEQQQVEANIKKEEDEKKDLKKEKEYIKSKEYIEKMAREKFGLFYPDEYVLRAKE